ncbi:MAG: pknB 31 [Planctomycetaceae bacterium]|nr:pknB 31 [Planctomycetaceae bacterium]
MPNDPQNVQEIFHRLVELPPAERSAAVERECGSNSELRKRIVALLMAHDESDSFLGRSGDAFTATFVSADKSAEAPATDAPSPGLPSILQIDPALIHSHGYRRKIEPEMVIAGRYILQQKIGEGGMGEVWLAKQTEPVKRQVALKLIKTGMDSKAVLTRFEQERQALAMMEHPNIARVLDGGVTPTGQPFFVMELVNGLTLTKFCDEARLTPRQRLELFVPICQAVQHAHQKGIVHRDLKPGNILITMVDGHPVPKVIDFGVAKATGGKLTADTMSTQFGAIVGTLEYMSPEQSGFSGVDVDTRADVYSLGVILYEMLTGLRPIDAARLKQAAAVELLRIIQEEEPSKPSTRLSTNEALPSLAALRQTDPRKLTALLRGELDWVVMKCLEKRRDRRYETANALGRDIQRYLADEPVEARPPSPGYRFGKFLKRNKGPVIAVCLVLLALVGGIIGTTLGLIRAVKAEQLAGQRFIEAEQQRQKAADLATAEAAQRRIAERRRQEADQERERADRNFRTARDAVDRMLTRVADELRGQPQTERVRRALLDDALQFYQGFLKEKSDDPVIRYEAGLSNFRIGNLYCFLGDWTEGTDKYRAAIQIFSSLSKSAPKNAAYREQLADSHNRLARALKELHDLDAGMAEYTRSIQLWDALAKDWPDHPLYLQKSAEVNWEVGSHLKSRYLYSKSTPFFQRKQSLQDEIVRRFPGYPTADLMKAAVNSLIPAEQASTEQQGLADVVLKRDYARLPHDPAILKQYEQELIDSLKIWEPQMQAHPDAPAYQQTGVRIIENLMRIMIAQGRFDELSPMIDRYSGLHTQLAARHPDNVEYQLAEAWSEYNRGNILYQIGRQVEARQRYERAFEACQSLIDQYPKEKRLRTHLAGLLVFCPIPELRNPRRAVEAVQRSMELSFVEGDWSDLAFAQFRAGSLTDALKSLMTARQLTPGDAKLDFTEAFIRLEMKEVAEARRLYELVQDVMDKTTNRYWYSLQFRFLRAEFEAKLKEASAP